MPREVIGVLGYERRSKGCNKNKNFCVPISLIKWFIEV
uniref:Uncharacterized protein n=1 Tax=Arundo donax TaxID=35708 RepID=A0A0A9FK68_ARUDO